MCYPAFTSASGFLSDRVQVRHDELLAGVAETQLDVLDVEVPAIEGMHLADQHRFLNVVNRTAPEGAVCWCGT